jgi:hypothetical protein
MIEGVVVEFFVIVVAGLAIQFVVTHFWRR